MRLSIILPVLNEAAGIVDCLESLQALRARGAELIVVDGGSRDGTPTRARLLADQVLTSPPGRARQMNTGAAVARGEVLWFLHADSGIPTGADRLILDALAEDRLWGRFDVRLSGTARALRIIEWSMNRRSRLTGIATGDQGIFVRREAFERVGGYPDIPLMEDIALSRALKRLDRPVCLHQRLITSSRRWERDGIWRTVFLMWRLRLAYWLGADPARLARRYYGG